jgi:3-deoxy-D-manno-octulosonate 8-phosphate phosphatase (KDO 8-P phosphatase)
MNLPPDELAIRARGVRLLLLDCDGVLTDGSLYYVSDGGRVWEAVKAFHIHDGQGLRLAREAGLKLGVISGRTSAALAERARELSFDHLYQGVADKLGVYGQIRAAEGLSDEQIAYLGDDLPDLPPLGRAGLALAVADAVAEVRDGAHYVTRKPGGRGAVREAVELILKAQGSWERLVGSFLDMTP